MHVSAKAFVLAFGPITIVAFVVYVVHDSIAVLFVVPPFAFVESSSVREHSHSLTAHLAILPCTVVIGSVGEIDGSIAMEHVFLVGSLISRCVNPQIFIVYVIPGIVTVAIPLIVFPVSIVDFTGLPDHSSIAIPHSVEPESLVQIAILDLRASSVSFSKIVDFSFIEQLLLFVLEDSSCLCDLDSISNVWLVKWVEVQYPVQILDDCISSVKLSHARKFFAAAKLFHRVLFLRSVNFVAIAATTTSDFFV